MKDETKKIIIICIVAVLLITSIIGNISAFSYKRQSDKLRREVESIRYELSVATDTNKRLGEQLSRSQSKLERCTGITNELRDTTGQSVETVRDCIKIVRETRTLIEDLENVLYNSDTNNSSS